MLAQPEADSPCISDKALEISRESSSSQTRDSSGEDEKSEDEPKSCYVRSTNGELKERYFKIEDQFLVLWKKDCEEKASSSHTVRSLDNVCPVLKP